VRRGRLSFSADPALTKEALSPEVGGGASFVLSSPAWFRLERRLSFSFLQGGWVRYTLPPLLQGNPPSRVLRSLLASLRRAPERVP